MTWLSFPVLNAFITIPTKRGPRNHPLIFFLFAFPLSIYKCPWPQPICIRPIFLPLPCMHLINPSNSFSEFSVSAHLCPLKKNVFHIKWRQEIIDSIVFISFCCIWSKERDLIQVVSQHFWRDRNVPWCWIHVLEEKEGKKYKGSWWSKNVSSELSCCLRETWMSWCDFMFTNKNS